MDYCDECGSSAHEEQLLICENCVTGWSSDDDENDDDDEDDDDDDDESGGGDSEAAARAVRKSKSCEPAERLRCFGSAHTFCLGLRDVPAGDWFCAACVAATAAQVRAMSATARRNNATCESGCLGSHSAQGFLKLVGRAIFTVCFCFVCLSLGGGGDAEAAGERAGRRGHVGACLRRRARGRGGGGRRSQRRRARGR
jgi:hypothetical protein